MVDGQLPLCIRKKRVRRIQQLRSTTHSERKLFFHLLRTPSIITVKQRDPFPLRKIKASVSCACNTHVLRIAQDLNARILLRIGLRDLGCAVSRTVIEAHTEAMASPMYFSALYAGMITETSGCLSAAPVRVSCFMALSFPAALHISPNPDSRCRAYGCRCRDSARSRLRSR